MPSTPIISAQGIYTLLDQGHLEQAMQSVHDCPRDSRVKTAHAIQIVEALHACYCTMSISTQRVLEVCQQLPSADRRRALTYALHFGQKNIRTFPVSTAFMQAFFSSWKLPLPTHNASDVNALVASVAQILLLEHTPQVPRPIPSKAWQSLEGAASTVLLSLLYQNVTLLTWVAAQMLLHTADPERPNALVLAWFLVVCNDRAGLTTKRDLVQKWLPYLRACTTHRSQILTLLGYTQQYLVGPRHEADAILLDAVRAYNPQTDLLWKIAAPLYLQSLRIHEGYPLSAIRQDCEALLQDPDYNLYPQASTRLTFMVEIVRALTDSGNAQLENSRYSLANHLGTMRGEITSSSRVHILPTVALLAWCLDNPSMVLRHLLGLEQLSYRIALCFLHPDHLVILCWALLKHYGTHCLAGESETAQLYLRMKAQIEQYGNLNAELFGARCAYVLALEQQTQNRSANALALLQPYQESLKSPANPILRYQLYHLGIHAALATSNLATARSYYQSAQQALQQWQATVLQTRLRLEHGWLCNEEATIHADAKFQLAIHRLVLDLVIHSSSPQQLGASLAQTMESAFGATNSYWIHAETLQETVQELQTCYTQEPAIASWLMRTAQTRQIIVNTPESPLAFIAIPYGTATACNLVILIHRYHSRHFASLPDWLGDLIPLVTQATALSEANMRMHSLAFQNVQAHENTRKRIAQDLHDNLGQDVALLQLKMGVLSHDLQKQNFLEAPMHLREAQCLIQTMGEKVRSISHELRPRDIDNNGLLASIQSLFLASFPAPTELQFQFSTAEPNIGIDSKIQLFRCLQEACKNIRKHAQARQVLVHTHIDGRFFTLVVQDDGVGLPLDFLAKPWSMGSTLGIMGMDERMKSVQGRFSIRSPQGDGTHLHFQVPLRHKESSYANLDT